MNDSVASDALVIPSSTGRPAGGFCRLGLGVLALEHARCGRPARRSGNACRRRRLISTLRSIWRMIVSMCLSLIVHALQAVDLLDFVDQVVGQGSTPSRRRMSCGRASPSIGSPFSTCRPPNTITLATSGWSSSRCRPDPDQALLALVSLPKSRPRRSISAMIAGSLGLRASNRSATRGRPPVMSRVLGSCAGYWRRRRRPTSAPSWATSMVPADSDAGRSVPGSSSGPSLVLDADRAGRSGRCGCRLGIDHDGRAGPVRPSAPARDAVSKSVKRTDAPSFDTIGWVCGSQAVVASPDGRAVLTVDGARRRAPCGARARGRARRSPTIRPNATRPPGVPVGCLHGLEVVELQRATLWSDLHGVHGGGRGDAAGVEGAHGQLRARLADRLGGDDADRLADVHQVTARQVASVAASNTPNGGRAGDGRTHLHRPDAGVLSSRSTSHRPGGCCASRSDVVVAGR